jgi:hypothetical protein
MEAQTLEMPTSALDRDRTNLTCSVMREVFGATLTPVLGKKTFALGSALFAIAGGMAISCGKSNESPSAVVNQAGDDASTGSDAAADGQRAPEEPVTTFDCGGTTCVVGVHACCNVGGGFGCFGLDAGGCPAGDGGAEAGSALLCLTYRNCKKEEDCCYRRDAGSSCEKSCEDGEIRLCTPGIDKCEDQEKCKGLSNAPLANMGQCDKDD